MAQALKDAFAAGEKSGKAVFVGFVTAGYPALDQTVDVLLGMQKGGGAPAPPHRTQPARARPSARAAQRRRYSDRFHADAAPARAAAGVIELGVPFTDPLADGATIQKTNEVALGGKSPVSLADCLACVKTARARGLTVPTILMGYYNPFLAYGLENLMAESAASGVSGFIVVDLPPEEGAEFVALCNKAGLSYVPLITPTSTDERIAQLSSVASSFMYCVSLTGVTGARTALPTDLSGFIERVRKHTDTHLAVGFGISTAEQVAEVGAIADGVVVGSAILKAIDGATKGQSAAAAVEKFISSISGGGGAPPSKKRRTRGGANGAPPAAPPAVAADTAHFGAFGGRYVPETLIEAHRELEEAYAAAKADPVFQAQAQTPPPPRAAAADADVCEPTAACA